MREELEKMLSETVKGSETKIRIDCEKYCIIIEDVKLNYEILQFIKNYCSDHDYYSTH